jgi:hypothetical protein
MAVVVVLVLDLGATATALVGAALAAGIALVTTSLSFASRSRSSPTRATSAGKPQLSEPNEAGFDLLGSLSGAVTQSRMRVRIRERR